jgi:hypothetical protein
MALPPTITKQFNSYKIWYYSAFSYEALIYCYSSGKYVGRMVFVKDNVPIPQNGIMNPFGPASDEPTIHFPISKFNDIINILRYEKPLILFLNTDNWVGILETAEFEPTGEQES